MEKPIVSIIIPVYNNEKYIRKCLSSVCAQTYKELQIIVINDGSTDGSSDIIKEYAEKDSRIIFIEQENRGVSSARNEGLQAATGEYLTFIDGDDYVGEDYIKELVNCAVKTGADMVITGISMVDPDGNLIKEIVPKGYKRFEHEEWAFRLSAVASHLYKRSLWVENSMTFYEGERGEDMPVSLFFAGTCENIRMLKKAEYYYVQHQSSAMHSFKKQDKSYLPYNALEREIKRCQEKGIKNDSDFHELFAIRIMATMINIAKGANREEIKTFAEYIRRILDPYYPNCGKNPYTRLFSRIDVPISQKVAVKALIIAYKMGILVPLLTVACR